MPSPRSCVSGGIVVVAASAAGDVGGAGWDVDVDDEVDVVDLEVDSSAPAESFVA
jgi:hypothetical protein